MKGIEIGGSVGAALGGIGRGVGSAVATGIRVGPPVGGLESGFAGLGRINGPVLGPLGLPKGPGLLGPSRVGLGSYVPEIVKEGPAKAADFAGFKRIGPVEAKAPKVGENTMQTTGLIPKGELRFNQPKKGPGFAEPAPSQETLISEVEAFLAQVRVASKKGQTTVTRSTPVEVVLPRKTIKKLLVGGPAWGVVAPSWPEPVRVPLEEVEKANKVKGSTKPEVILGLQPKTEAKVSSKTTSATLTQPATKEIEEVVEEKVLVNKKGEVKPEVKEEKDSSALIVKIVKAEEIAKKRQWQIKAATRRVTGKITGKKVGDALSAAYWQLISLIPGLRRDYTLALTAAEIESDSVEYESPEQAGEAYIKAVEHNTPIKQGEDGRIVTVEEFRKVTKGENTPVSGGTPAKILVRRIIKKRVEVDQAGLSTKTALEEQTEIKGEVSLRELSPKLAEVFQKAA